MAMQLGTTLKAFISENKDLFTLNNMQALFNAYAEFIYDSNGGDDTHSKEDDLLLFLLTGYSLSDILSRMVRIPKEMFLWYEGPLVIPENIKLIQEEAFFESDITSVKLPESLKEVSNSCFRECYKLMEVEFGYNLKRIGEEAFCDCILKEIKIPKSVTTIGAAAFGSCPITKVTIPWGFKDWLENIFDEKTVSTAEFTFI